MIVKIDKSFEKDTRKISDRNILKSIATCIKEAEACGNIRDLKSIKKLKGFPHYYRFKIGEYRLGVYIQGKEVIFERVLHRKDIYRFFP